MNGRFFFADISGFTKTTEMFIKKTQYGPEVIRDIVDSIFNRAIEKIYKESGYVVLFAGDGILFYLKDEAIDGVKSEFEESIFEFNKKMSTDLGIKIDQMEDPLYPHTVKTKEREFIYFHPQKSSISYEDIKDKINLDFPKIIREMREKNAFGELREIPAGFINISGEKNPNELKEFFEHLISEADREQIYVNKIEWADKGWMVLVACGLPVSVENAPLKLLRYMNCIIKKAEEDGIKIKAGCTLRKGYAGIIGNQRRWEYTFIGGNINLAARIAVKGREMKVCSDNAFAEALSSAAVFEKIGEFSFKGIEEGIEVFSFLKYSEESKTSLFVGREFETASAKNALAEVSPCLVISGEGGIGKTHFVNSILKYSSVPKMTVSCSPKREPFYIAMKILLDMRVFKKCFDSYESLFLKTAKIQSVKERFKYFISSFDREAIIIIDDSQYIDVESMELLKWVLFEGVKNIKFIFMGRDVSNISFIKSKLSKFSFLELPLKGFSEIGVSDFLLKSTLFKPKTDDVKEMARISDGNPLFLSQIISFMQREDMIESKNGFLNFKSRIKDFPYSLKELILVKFDKFPNQTKSFVETGAVIGEEFTNSVALNSIGSMEENFEDTIMPAVENRILSRKLETVSMFYHSIIKQTIFDRMLKKRIDEICVKVGDEMAKNSDNPFMLLQAGDFYASAGNMKAFDMYISAVNLFRKEKNAVYASHSLNKAFLQNAGIEKQVEAIRLYPDISEQHINKEFLENAYEILTKIQDHLTKNDSFVFESIAYGLLNILRDTAKAKKLMRIYKKKIGERLGYYMLKARIEQDNESPNEALRTYLTIKKNFKMTPEEEFKYFKAVSSTYFFHTADRKNLASYLKKLEQAAKKIKNESLLAEYRDFMTSVFLHTNEMKKAEIFAKKNLVYAKKRGKTDFLTSLYNTFAIINSNKFFVTKKRKYEYLSLKYHKKIYEIYRKDMNLSILPLITTNLGMAYLMAGDAEKNFHYLYEGLLYGIEVDHPVEVPYNYILLSLFMYERGAEMAAFNLSDLIISYKHKIDIGSTAYFLKYLQTGERKYHRKGMLISKMYMKRQNTPPLQIYYDLMFEKYYKEGDVNGMKSVVKQAESFEQRVNLRQNVKNKYKQMRLILEIESDTAQINKTGKLVEETKNMRLNSVISIMMLFSFGKFLIRKNINEEGIQKIIEARKLSKKLLFFNYTAEIDEYLVKSRYGKERFIKQSKKSHDILEKVSILKDLEEFKAFIEK